MACTFCSIVEDRQAAEVVLRTDQVLGFLDHRPLFLGHVLVIPLTHVETLPDLAVASIPPLFEAVRLLCRAVELGLGAEGTLVAINNRISQSVPHLHVHVVPRRKKDGLRGFFWPRIKYPSATDCRQTGDRVREAVRYLRIQGGS